MVKIGENLLKLAEYPFSYSFIAILFLLGGKTINFEELTLADFGPMLLLIGFLGTGLAIIDPFGKLIRSIIILRSVVPRFLLAALTDNDATNRIKQIDSEIESFEREYSHENERLERSSDLPRGDINLIRQRNAKLQEAINDLRQLRADIISEKRREEDLHRYAPLLRRVEETRWISIDIEKNIAMFYYACLLLVFVVILPIPNVSQIFTDYFNTIFNTECLPNDCEMLNAQMIWIIETICIVGLAAIGLSIWFALRKIIRRSSVVYTYLLASATKLENPNLQLIEQFMSAGDWGRAEFHARLLEFELTKRSSSRE